MSSDLPMMTIGFESDIPKKQQKVNRHTGIPTTNFSTIERKKESNYSSPDPYNLMYGKKDSKITSEEGSNYGGVPAAHQRKNSRP